MCKQYSSLIEEFGNSKVKLNRVQSTADEYMDQTNRFAEWLLSKSEQTEMTIESWRNVTRKDCSNYSQFLRKTLSVNTTKKHFASIGQFFSFLMTEYDFDSNPSAKTQIKKDKQTEEKIYLLHEQGVEIFEASKTNRDKLLVGLQLYLGLRQGEAVSIKTKHVDLENWRIKVFREKGKRWQTLPIVSALKDLIKEYMETTCIYRDYLFQSPRVNQPITTRAARDVFNEICDNLGFDKSITMHQLRRLFAIDLYYNKGFQIHQISKLLDHSDISITQIYLSSIDAGNINDKFAQL